MIQILNNPPLDVERLIRKINRRKSVNPKKFGITIATPICYESHIIKKEYVDTNHDLERFYLSL